MSTPKRTAVFSVANKAYRVITTASDEEIAVLSRLVDERIRGISGGRPVTLETAVLVAMSFAHDAELNRTRADQVENDARSVMGRVLDRIDSALGPQDGPDQAESDA